jgi:UDP-N-acetylmuramyl pentapeptide phosphotransferase/UDP-N-acetylglucosamine-1-phosphate transferase
MATCSDPDRSWLLALLLTPWVIASHRRAATSTTRPRASTHGASRDVRRRGGVRLALRLLALAPFVAPVRDALVGYESLGALGLGTALMVALGAYDDLYDMRPLHKLRSIAIAVLTWVMGFRVGSIGLPFELFLTRRAVRCS